MQFDEFSSKINRFGNASLLLHQEHLRGVFNDFHTATSMLGADFHNIVFQDFTNYVDHVIEERKVLFSNQVLDVEEYVDQLITEGITVVNKDRYEIFRDYNISSEVINIYKLKYTIHYYERMTDIHSSDSWIYHPLEFEKLTSDEHLYYVSQTELLFQQLDL